MSTQDPMSNHLDKRDMKDGLAALADVQVLHFDDLTKLLSFEDYEASCERLSSQLDRHGIRVDCSFERKVPSGISRSRSRTLMAHYRWEVQQIPFMDRQQERQFIMGVDFLWRRLKATRESAGFALEDANKQPLFPINAIPGTLLNRPMWFTEFLDNGDNVANKPIIFGDPRFYVIAERRQLGLVRLIERYAPNVALQPTARVGGQVVLPEAFRIGSTQA